MKMNMVTIEGIVGAGQCAPVKKMLKDQNGNLRPVMWFTLLYNDNSWKDEQNKTQYNRKFLKVFLPRNEYGEKQLSNIHVGRLLSVTGTVKADVYTRTKEDGTKEYLPSLTMSDSQVQFLDLPLDKQIRNLMEIANEQGCIDKDDCFNVTATELVESICKHVGTLKAKVIEETNTGANEKTGIKRQF